MSDPRYTVIVSSFTPKKYLYDDGSTQSRFTQFRNKHIAIAV